MKVCELIEALERVKDKEAFVFVNDIIDTSLGVDRICEIEISPDITEVHLIRI